MLKTAMCVNIDDKPQTYTAHSCRRHPCTKVLQHREREREKERDSERARERERERERERT